MHTVITGLETLNRLLGRIAAWTAIIMVFAQISSIIMRYLFSYGVLWMQESVVYGHAIMFLLGAAFVLQTNAHVRVDIFYAQCSHRTQRIIDLIGMLLFVLPVSCAILWSSWPYVEQSWLTLEGSRQAGGIPAIFLLKTAILIFAVSLISQAIATSLKLIFGYKDLAWGNREKNND